jgi:hypothetical protein
VQWFVELSVTDFSPSPLVLTVGVKLLPTVAEPGMFEIVGVVGVPWPMLKDWTASVAGAHNELPT